jgi:hypothetical protein
VGCSTPGTDRGCARESIPRRLDDENPVIPLAVDVDDDVAIITLLSWSEQNSGWKPSLWNATLVEHEGDWHCANASGSLPPRDYPLAARRPADQTGLHIRIYEAGPQHTGTGDKRWLSAAIHVTAEVETLRIGDRDRPVPFHGYLPVVVRDRAQAVVAALSGDGSVLETIDLRRRPSDFYRELRLHDPDGWPLKIK